MLVSSVPTKQERHNLQKAWLKEQLVEAERHISQGERSIARQRRAIARLEASGGDSGQARELLAVFESTQTLTVADRDRIRALLIACRICPAGR
ncbi:MAG: hypothetical protein JOZ93_14570 [Sinobacteraceae bacterium]|nr:hypothetical protein [Nevskiaceae bacterium]